MPDTPAHDSELVALPPVLDTAAAHALKETLVEAAASLRAAVVLDGAGVERIGTPAVQVLVAADRALAAASRTFTLTNPSRVLCAAFDDLGLAAELKRWSGC